MTVLLLCLGIGHGIIATDKMYSLSTMGAGNWAQPCKVCTYVIQGVKKSLSPTLPTLCTTLYAMSKPTGTTTTSRSGSTDTDPYTVCKQVLDALGFQGQSVRTYLNNGCTKYEMYGEQELVLPCPSHVICSELKRLDGVTPFCKAPLMDQPYTPDKQ